MTLAQSSETGCVLIGLNQICGGGMG